MARVRINRLEARVQTQDLAAKLVRQVMYEIEFAAKLKTLQGPYTTGELALSIHGEGPNFLARAVSGRVGSQRWYARIVHDGAKVHWIFPKRRRGVIRYWDHKPPQLSFFWRKKGHRVYFPHIPGSPTKVGLSHPGQPGKRFLTSTLPVVAARHNMRLVIYDVNT